VHPQDSYQSPSDNNVNITSDETDLQVHPQDSYQSHPSNINNSASATDSQVHPRDSYQSPPEKLKEVLDFPLPSTQKALLQFIGLVNYFRDHVPNMTEMIHPLRALVNMKNYKVE